jgi:hypothetical protein
MHNLFTACFCLKRPFDGFDLAADAPDPIEQPLLISHRMHVA